ncbi:MAG TPA: GTP cyclohydrolase FolE2 [Chiayiivirga sp.]|nr:GTP cyclohydrolase FolE2 [Chiayiivirga sp.]
MTDLPPPDSFTDPLADEVARMPAARLAPLDRVGMRGIEMPVRVLLDDGPALLPARVEVAVDLRDPAARGIHMSRLYRLCDAHVSAAEPLDRSRLRALLEALLASHAGLSQGAWLGIAFELPLRRVALLSGLSGWRQYPVRIAASLEQGRWRCELGVDVLYSSTCPGSAAMARQVVAQRFSGRFGGGAVDAAAVARWLESPDGGAATPHAQRSRATLDVRLADGIGEAHLPMAHLVDLAERALATPVQAAVKRMDEQEFARLNGAHPMYCEDAARRLAAALDAEAWVADYAIEAAHLESLHPHDAVARVVKGVAGGFTPD